MPLKLNGSTSGSVTIQAPAIAGINTLTLPAATGNLLSDQSIVPGSASIPTNGMYLPATNALGFATNSTNAMYIDASQNVGIGTTSPRSSTGFKTLGIDASTTPILDLFVAGTRTGTFSATSSSVNLTAVTAIPLIFNTTNAEAMRIDSSGNVLVNTTTTMAASLTFPTLVVNSGPFSKGAGAGYFWENRSATATATTNWYGWYTTSGTIYVYNGSANIGSINASTGAYTALSDATKKKDFEPSTFGLSAVLQLKPTLYRMKDADDSSQKELGFIAQEVKDIIPQAYVEQTSPDASGVESTYIGLNDRPIIAALVAAIQELSAEVEALKAKIGV